MSLLEMSIAVLILAIIAAVVIPNLAANDPGKLDVAAREVANAVRFARAEAMRTRNPHGITTDPVNERVSVYRLDGWLPVHDVYHPVDKKLYAIELKTHPFAAGVDLVSSNFTFEGGFNSSTILGFNSDGMPKFSVLFVGDFMLSNGTITLGQAGQQRVVSISPMTGRVTIQ